MPRKGEKVAKKRSRSVVAPVVAHPADDGHVGKKGRRKETPSLPASTALPASPGGFDEAPWPALFDPAALTQGNFRFVSKSPRHGPWIFEPEIDSRMVRPAVLSSVWARLEELRTSVTPRHRGGVLIMGHPGIGKTLMLDVLLSMCLHAHPDVPVLTLSEGGSQLCWTLDGKRKRWIMVEEDPPQIVKAAQALLAGASIPPKSPIVVLHDIKGGKGFHYQGPLIKKLFKDFTPIVVVASSAERDNYKLFEKDTNNFRRMIVPTLSFEESATFIRHHHPAISDDTCAEWYYKVGGVPRHLKDEETVADMVALQEIRVGNVIYHPRGSGTDEMTNSLVRMVPDASGRRAIFDFVSDHACELWSTTHNDAARIEKFFNLLRTQPQTTRDALGRWFETWTLSVIRPGCTFFRSLLSPDPGLLQRWEVPAATNEARFAGISFDRMALSQAAGVQLHVPMASNFPFVDAVLTVPRADGWFDATLLQVTVAETHRPTRAGVKRLLENLTAKSCVVTGIVWLVDGSSKLRQRQALADGAAFKPYDDIPQYLCRLEVDANMRWVQRDGKPSNTAVAFPCLRTTQATILAEVKSYVDPTANRIVQMNLGTQERPTVFA